MPSQPQFPQFEEMPTFAEAHFEKELLTQIYVSPSPLGGRLNYPPSKDNDILLLC
jgi:hypothetical protein